MNELTANTDKKLKHILAEPIVLGASISPAEFDESGNAYYVSMATIKTLEIELDDTQLVSDRYFKKKKDDKSVQMYDIIIARSGVAIGKSAIIKDDFEGIFADFTMRIRIDNTKYNPIFTYYYIRTKYFQYLIEVYKKGLQNQNIFPIVLKEFPIPDIALSEQAKIVAKIQNTLAKQDNIKEEIEHLRNQIDETILHIIRE
ncbi:restriction endonuclease subunit S [Parablautia intestinalis]|uniref:Restriction endonuclease subunit S n=2 Tax=Parablautia intestinalis TaxID=2320100 RepID=A0A3A9AEP9_9FIRM|nr:restriction endonuclease subunit S [Parablautia intestinalis]